MEITNWLKIILDSLYDGILIADKNGVVVYINPSYTRITGIKSNEIIMKKLLDIRPGSHLTDVIKNGKKELGIYRKVGNIEYTVNMVPIYIENKICGGISILNELNDIYKLTEKLKISRNIIKKLEENVKILGSGKYSFEDIIAVDKTSIKTKKFAQKISKSESTVLITGDSGTGKELYASAIHNFSKRENMPFIAVNCATIEKSLMESEFFGYEGGAFTGAKKEGKVGLFQLADGGTLFLDEIGELGYEVQGKLLRFLEDRQIRRVGGTREKTIDIRLICATNRNLEKMVEEGKFRSDLYYRINIIPLHINKLSERKADILPLIKKFIEDLNFKYKRNVKVSYEAEKILTSYKWRGNIRELRNIMEFLYNISENDLIGVEDIPNTIKGETSNNLEEIKTLKEVTKEFEKSYIKKALDIYGDSLESKKEIAKKLGISLASLYNKI